MPQGYVALVLHAHLPFVRHPEYSRFMEEDWLFEAITETYIPLIKMMDGLLNDGIDFRLTMTISPPLCAMLMDPLLQDRYVQHISRLVELSNKEIERTRWQHEFHELAWHYHQRFNEARNIFCDQYHRNLVTAFRKFQDAGKLEIITCGATHGFLPLMRDIPQAVRAQIFVARDHYRECFGRDPRGIWLPECAYFHGLERVLSEAEIRYFLVDTHGILFAEPRPRYGVYSPVFTRSGPAAFGRDIESSKQVWSAEEGYPGDCEYRDFYRDVGFDMDLDYVRPYIHGDGIRCCTGMKYFRITGKTAHKQPYRPQAAREKASTHAGNFMFNREKQVEYLAGVMGRPPIIVAPYDAELYGHWWYEGPDFLNYFIRKSIYDQKVFGLTTPAEYLQRHSTQQIAQPSESSWGYKGYWEVWLEGSNTWIYPHLNVAAERMTELARHHQNRGQIFDRAITMAGRELLLAQASDWAFIMKTGTTVSYAVQRTKEHILRFTRLYEQIKNGHIDENFLRHCEWKDSIFLNLNYNHWC
ncbi:MAG: DUF1957 domain-containing protein [Verrucomicrobiae bacterium]|nr:DUF1957 domain-containing protein [Verrucomicrobiae bacterium]